MGQAGLIRLRISDVAPRVFDVLLNFIYTNRVEGLPPDLLLPEGLAMLFDAAERHLVFHMKVCRAPSLPCQHNCRA